MSQAYLLTAKDFRPLREDLAAMDGALDAVEAAVRDHYQGRIRQHHIVDRVPGEFEGIRVALSAGDGVLSGMRVFGNPPHTRAFLLFDGTTRAMMALMDYGVLNSMRVGAIAGVAARHLAPANARVLGLIGSGWQAPTQVAAMKRALPALERIKVFSPTREHRESFAASMTKWTGIAVDPVASIREALDGADVVDLCAPGHFDVREPLFEPAWVKPGALVISMAASQCTEEFVLGVRIVGNWRSIAVDVAPRPPYEGPISRGQLTEKDLTELGSVIVDRANPRQGEGDTVLYQLEGGNVHDLYVASWGYGWARERNLGLPFDLSE
jgi:alanine dehydrogenase